jgi:O-antigen ligase
MVASAVQVHGVDLTKKLLSWSVVAAVIVTFSIWFDVPNVTDRGGGLIGNSSFAGAYFSFNVFFAGFLLLSSYVKRFYKWPLLLFLVFVFFSPLFINSFDIFQSIPFGQARGATLGILIGGMSAFFVWLFLSSRISKKTFGALGILGLVFVCAFVGTQALTSGTFINQKFVEHATSDRLVAWNISKQALIEKPVLGWGVENFTVAFNTFYDSEVFMHEPNFDRAHNIFWDTAVSAGIPLVIFYVGILVLLFYLFYVLFKKNILNRAQTAILCGLVVAYVVQNLFVFDMLPSLLMFYLLIGITSGLVSFYFPQEESKFIWEKQTKFKQSIILIFVSIVIFSAFIYTTLLPFMRIYLIHDFLKFF